MSLEHSPARQFGSAAQAVYDDPERLMRPEETAKFLGLSPRGLENLRHRGGGPKFVRISKRCVRYRRGTAIDYAAARTFASTSEEA